MHKVLQKAVIFDVQNPLGTVRSEGDDLQRALKIGSIAYRRDQFRLASERKKFSEGA